MPAALKKENLVLQRGDEPKFMKSGILVACAWQDVKRVTFLTTVNSDNTIDKDIRSRTSPDGVRTVEKPVIAEDYNLHMGGVDR